MSKIEKKETNDLETFFYFKKYHEIIEGQNNHIEETKLL